MEQVAPLTQTPPPMPAPVPEALPAINDKDGPSAGFCNSGWYWWNYAVRHYMGAGWGHYGPRWTAAMLRGLERRIAKRSAKSGDRPWKPVPEVDGQTITAQQFQDIYLKSNTPVVLRGFAKEWPAVKQWSPEFFKERYGNDKIPVRYKADKLDEVSLKYVEKTVTELVDNIRGGGMNFGGNLEDIFNRHNELREMLDIPKLTQFGCETKRGKIGSTQLFMSGNGTRSGFHCTGGINLFVQVYGQKDWSFVSPRYAKWMRPITRKDMFYAATFLDWDKSFDEIEKDGYPLFRFAPKFRTLLEPGDVLFSPQWWWHAVNTPCPSIAVATRTINRFTLGTKAFAALWFSSPKFLRLLFHLIKTGWGSDEVSGARLAFEAEFVNKTTH